MIDIRNPLGKLLVMDVEVLGLLFKFVVLGQVCEPITIDLVSSAEISDPLEVVCDGAVGGRVGEANFLCEHELVDVFRVSNMLGLKSAKR